jgi:phenylacetic acid degradation operon negative regulatory protein
MAARHRTGRLVAGAQSTADTQSVLDLPRTQAGSPQHLLTTLLGDYWLQRPEYLPSAALASLLSEFDVTLTAARAAVNRLNRRGLLVTAKSGRNALYRIAPEATDVLAEGAYRFVSFGATSQEWDGQWTLASFSLSEAQRDLRYPVRAQLRWLDFAPLYDGMWISPRPIAAQALAALAELGLRDATVFRAVEVPGAGRQPIEAWDVDGIARMYSDFVNGYAPLRQRIRDGGVTATQALVARTRIIDSWRSFPGRDPDLPRQLLPQRWPREEAHEVFVELYDALGPLAAIRVRQILDNIDPDLAELVHYHTTASLLELGSRAYRRRRETGQGLRRGSASSRSTVGSDGWRN